jgi:ATP-binding cassette subfamily B protein
MPTARNLFDLLDHQGEEDQMHGSFVHVPPPGRVVFDNVSFLYPSAPREPGILGQASKTQGVWDLTFHVEPGETVALVGPTGAGKSTCLALLQRLYSPDHGRILIDDQDIAGLDVQSLCAQIATVFQEPGLFNRSIYDNILVGRPTASREEVEDAARLAHAHAFILTRPGGYDFVVGERGMALSGGERQRIAIARAILKNAPILILDEATSALDNETEKLVQAAMDRLRVGKTTFVIAHRLSTIVSADRIFVMADGRIVESGSFQALRERKGLFARLLHAGELGEASAAEASVASSVAGHGNAVAHTVA